MTTLEFDKPYSGSFWLADTPEVFVPGSLTLTGEWQRLELYGLLTETEKVVSRNSHEMTLVPADIGNENVTIHGMIANHGRATLLKSDVNHYSRNLMHSGLEVQRFVASYALVGRAHVDGPETRYSEFQFRARGLDEWARLQGLSHVINKEAGHLAISFQHTLGVPAPLRDGSGTVSFELDASLSPLTVTGSRITNESWVRINTSVPRTLDQIVNEFAGPLADLMTLLFGVDCSRDRLKVRDRASGEMLEVFCYGQRPTGPVDKARPLLYLKEFGLDNFASWFDVVAKFTPLVQLLGAVVSEPGRTVQNQLLELASACEGLHRRRSDECRIGADEVSRSLAILKDSNLDEKVKGILSDALRIYLWEPSFPQRMEGLAKDAGTAVPGVSGRTNKWKRAVAEARNGFAHSLVSGADPTESILGYVTLTQSLRWLMLGLFLAESGISEQVLGEKLREYVAYKRFLSDAKERLPEIYR